MEALRDLADDFNVRDPQKLYRLARQRVLDVTQAMAFEALKADVGRQVQAPRPRALGKSAAEGPNDWLAGIDFSQNTRGKRPPWNLYRTRTPRRWSAPQRS